MYCYSHFFILSWYIITNNEKLSFMSNCDELNGIELTQQYRFFRYPINFFLRLCTKFDASVGKRMIDKIFDAILA